jgi:hypothetical protein
VVACGIAGVDVKVLSRRELCGVDVNAYDNGVRVARRELDEREVAAVEVAHCGNDRYCAPCCVLRARPVPHLRLIREQEHLASFVPRPLRSV